MGKSSPIVALSRTNGQPPVFFSLELSGEVMIVIAPPDARLIELFERVDRIAGVGCRYCMPDTSRLWVYVCRGLRQPLPEVWPRLKRYI